MYRNERVNKTASKHPGENIATAADVSVQHEYKEKEGRSSLCLKGSCCGEKRHGGRRGEKRVITAYNRRDSGVCLFSSHASLLSLHSRSPPLPHSDLKVDIPFA